MRAVLIIAALAAVLATAAAPALAAPPAMPGGTKGSKPCGMDVRNRHGAHFGVYVTKGERRVSCRRARSIVKQGVDVPGWRYYDWTKGGDGPWSDVWQRRDGRAVVGAIIRCVEGLDDDADLPPCHESRQP
jgi:hypothetical protein